MTNEEALDILERQLECDNDNCPEPGISCSECPYNVDPIDYARARKMAIEALDKQCASTKQVIGVTAQTKFKPGDKFILELGAERRMFDEFEIKGTDLYVKTSLLEKLTRFEPISLESAINIDYLYEAGWLQEHDRVLTEHSQPEKRCVNCGRTANNGGWYKDGRTRCPIEEHYALPKDGYCHLWEKTKVWEDDYVKRPEESEK